MTAASRSPLAMRDFRLLWIGEAVSALGDQFALVALPWLALLLTGSALALGTVLAVMAVPRAVFMIIGGAYVDRLSPRRVMFVSNALRLLAVSVLSAVVLVGAAELWMLYVFALVFGVADAFYYPAQTAIVPELVDSTQLQQANGITQGTTQFTVLVGPALAGIAIAVLGAGGANPGVTGVGIAMLIDGVTFLVSLLTLLLIHPRQETAQIQGSVFRQIGEGIRFVSQQPALLVVMLVSMCANVLIVGPLDVGIPLVAYNRLPEGAAAFGLILSGFGGGSLLGLLAATVLPAVPPARFGALMMGLMAVAGISLAGLAFVQSTTLAVSLSAVAGTMIGYTNVSFITWVQRRVPQRLMGRVMSILVFAAVSLVPISIAVAGVAVTISLDGVLIFSGLGFAVVSLGALASRSVRRMGLQPVLDHEPAAVDERVLPQPEPSPAA